MAEWQILGDAIGICPVHDDTRAKRAAALWILGREQMPLAGAHSHDFSGARNLEPFRHGFSCLYSFRPTHKFVLSFKKSAQYRIPTRRKQEVISLTFAMISMLSNVTQRGVPDMLPT